MKNWMMLRSLLLLMYTAFSSVSDAQETSPYIMRLAMPYQNLSGNYTIQWALQDGKMYTVAGSNYTFALQDENGTVSGKICNDFRGSYQSTMGNTMAFGPIISTRKICIASADENIILGWLPQVNGFRLQDETLLLMKDGEVVMHLLRNLQGNNEKPKEIQNIPPQISMSNMHILQVYHAGELINISADSATLSYDAGESRIHGKAICNRYFGQARFTATTEDRGTVSISAIGSTMMACPKNRELESSLLKALEASNNYAIDAGQLYLSKDKTLLMILAMP